MTVVTTDAPFPPYGTQIKVGPGTLVSVVVPQPRAVMTGSTPLDVSFYDTSTGDISGGAIEAVVSDNGYKAVSLNVQFTKGLFVMQRTPSAVQVTTA